MCTLLQPVAGLYVGNLNALARTLCCKVGTLLMRYLGMPLGAHYKQGRSQKFLFGGAKIKL